MLFVCYPNCSTCKKARAWLESHGIPFAERNIKTENPTREELAQCPCSASSTPPASSTRPWG